MADHQSVIVRKPWGYEYLVYLNQHVAVWLLHIEPRASTSMHCHPNKSTGLVLLDGQAEISFIADSRRLIAPAKQMIRRGLFHQTCAISDTPVKLFEVETPVDKDDLVRLRDVYGRENIGYENSDFELPKNQDCLWIQEPTDTPLQYHVGISKITVEKLVDINCLYGRNPDDIIMFMSGGLTKTINGRLHMVTQPGDVGQVKVVSQVAKEMDQFAENTIIWSINENL